MTRCRRFVLLVLAGLAGLMAGAPPALAHPTLVATVPEAGYSVTEPPEEIGLVFDERVAVTELVLEGQARGDVTTGDPQVSADGTRIVVRPEDPLPDGVYTVRWQVVGSDGHDVDGTFGFGVGAAAAPSGAASAETSGLGTAVVLRWAMFAALAVSLGGLAGDALARRRARLAGPERALVAPQPWTLVGSVLGVVASVGLGLHALGAGSLVGGLSNPSVAALLDTPAGRLVAVQIGAFALAAAAAVRPHRRWLAAALTVVVIAEGWRSHLQTEAPPLGSITIMVHLAAVAIWIGGLVHVLRAAVRWRHTTGQARVLFLEYTWMAVVVYGVVVVTGTVAAVLVLPTLDALWSTSYGQVLMAKLALVAVATGLALSARRRLYRHHSAPRTIQFARIEWTALVTVLAASAVLASMAPPTDLTQGLAYPPPNRGATVRLGTLAGQITTGIIAGAGQLEVRLRLPEWDPNARHDFSISGTITRPNGDQAALELEPCGAGCFVSPAQWDEGANTIELDVQARDWQGAVAEFDVAWPPEDAEALFDQMLATMTDQPTVTFVESATSDTTRPTPFQSDELQATGVELIDLQPYRSGTINAPTVLNRTGEMTEIGFAISAESIYVRQTLDPAGRLLEETLVSPNHLLERVYTYD
jgi:copper transport protein